MSSSFASADVPATTVRVIGESGFEAWKSTTDARAIAWLEATGFKAKAPAVAYWPDSDGGVGGALLVCSSPAECWDVAALRLALPAGIWRLDDPDGLIEPAEAAYGWALAGYRFDRYKGEGGDKSERLLQLDDGPTIDRAKALADAVKLGRDLVNTPANDMGPEELAASIFSMAKRFDAVAEVTVGADLLAQNFPLVHTVGAASSRAPRLVDMVWGDPGHPKVTLVGKGVCFDTGGLDIKPPSAMLNMKKDMGGSAAMIALAQAVMATGLPVRMRLIVPAVENSVSGRAFRPGDVIKSRKGITVEIGNTDAEGRLVLADALALADEERPGLIIDAATLTGAARVGLGTELPALFSNDDALAGEILAAGQRVNDPLWRLPLHEPYRKLIKGSVGDINNAGTKPFAGSITAALFLKSFVTESASWAHLDIFGSNDDARPGRPRGGEATALRPLYEMLQARFGAGA